MVQNIYGESRRHAGLAGRPGFFFRGPRAGPPHGPQWRQGPRGFFKCKEESPYSYSNI